MIANLIKFFKLATPTELEQADWYYTASQQCFEVAVATGIEFQRIVWAVAALSPMCYWDRNILGVVQLALTGKTGHGFGKNRIKALKCLAGDFEALRGDKVTRFAANLFDPKAHQDDVVVDMWAWRAYQGVVAGEAKSLTKLQYQAIADDYKSAAVNVGLAPSEFQAVVWTVVRRLGKGYQMAKRAVTNARKQALKDGRNYNHQVSTHQPFGGKGVDVKVNPSNHSGTLGEHKAKQDS